MSSPSLRLRALFPWLAALSACAADPLPPPDGTKPSVDLAAASGLDTRPVNRTCIARRPPPTDSPVTWTQVFPDVKLSMPTVMAQIPGDGSRWFVAQRGAENGVLTDVVSFSVATPTEARVVATVGPVDFVNDGEGGLIGMAFHPRFAENGRLFLSYVAPGTSARGRSVIAYVTSADGGLTFGAPTEVLSFDQPAGNHKGGGLAFGSDGYLYASFGDGHYPGDLDAHGQRTDLMFSKILRIDVDVPGPSAAYGIPPDNPFAAGGGEPAAYAWGFRNPFRFSFDRVTGDLWVGDVGEDTREEIDLVVRGGNYGWPCREGTFDLLTDDPLRCPDPKAAFVDPVFEHPHNGSARSITGGFVYRGAAVPELNGTYVYGDFITQELFALAIDPRTSLRRATLLNPQGPTANWVSFAEDHDGELYGLSLMQGSIYKMVPAAERRLASDFPERLSETGCVRADDPRVPAEGLVPYDVNVPFWSDGAEKARWVALPEGASIHVGEDGDMDLPNGSVVMKSFSLQGRLVETRFMMRDDTGTWTGYSYEWNEEQTDAVLLLGGKVKPVGGQSWIFPSTTDCNRCHTAASGGTIGLELGQLDRSLDYPVTGRRANQLKTLEHVGMLEMSSDVFASRTPFPAPTGDAPLEARARAYLHANCSYCHRPEGGGRELDLRYAHALDGCDAPPAAGDLGIPDARLLAPGDPDRSLIHARVNRRDWFRMPPLGSAVIDAEGVALLGEWIRSMDGCPTPAP